MKKQILLTFIIFVVFISIFSWKCQDTITPTVTETSSTDIIKSSNDGNNQRYIEGEILVKFYDGTSENIKQSVLTKINGKSKTIILTKAMADDGDTEGMQIIKTSISTSEAVKALNNTAEVEYAEPNYIYRAYYTNEDPYYTNGSLWGMYGPSGVTTPANQFGTGAGKQWLTGKTGSTKIYVGVIDEGIDYSHPDLIDNIDLSHSFDFVNNDKTIYHGSKTDLETDAHGTHVAGIIGAKGGNKSGVAGMCWNIKIISARFLGKDGGTTADAVRAIDTMVTFKKAGLNIVAINASWGSQDYSLFLYKAIDRAKAAGILFIAAAGNDKMYTDLIPFYHFLLLL
jgi:thermitase